MKVIYIAGPYRGPTAWDIEQNVRRAETVALEVWRLGAAALCPHANSRYFQGQGPDSLWLDGTMEMMRRCDAVLVVATCSSGRPSAGTSAEITGALHAGLPVFFGITELEAWIGGRP